MPISTNGVQAAPQANKRRSNNWKPGESGNPLGGALLKARNEAQRQRHAELREAVAAEFPDPTALEQVLIGQAADMFERSERGPHGDAHAVRLVRAALQVLDRIREGRKERQAPALSALDHYLASKAGAGA